MSQPAPTPNDRPAVWPQVIADMQQRHFIGVARYGVALQPFNGRKALKDAYDEVLDMAVYLKQELIERAERESQPADDPLRRMSEADQQLEREMERDSVYEALFRQLAEAVLVNETNATGRTFGRCRVCWATTGYGKTRDDIDHEPDCPLPAALSRAAELERGLS